MTLYEALKEIERLRADIDQLLTVLSLANDLTEIVRMPNAEYIADAHNRAVACLQGAIKKK